MIHHPRATAAGDRVCLLSGQEAEDRSIPPFTGLFFHSNLIVKQSLVQDFVEAEEDLDLKRRTPKWRRAGV